MAARSAKASLSHEERTAEEPREKSLHPIILDNITPVNDKIRVYRFLSKDRTTIPFLAGQWVDLHVPGIEKAGGFTITSTPRNATPTPHNESHPYIDLAVQESPENPPAAWLWQPEESILGRELAIRVGGSFVWPPHDIKRDAVTRVVLIAGGVGINPLISIAQQITEANSESAAGIDLRIVYSTKLPSSESTENKVLFLPRLLESSAPPTTDSSHDLPRPGKSLQLFFTGTWDGSSLSSESRLVRKLNAVSPGGRVSAQVGRIGEMDLQHAVGNEEDRKTSVYYVCGPPAMTDEIVEWLQKQEGVKSEQVLCEKWW